MRRYDARLWIGILLVLGGILSLLDVSGVISNAGGIFWGLIWGALGAVFLYMLLTNRGNWWAAFPAFTLLGLSASSFLPSSLDPFKGLVFFAGIRGVPIEKWVRTFFASRGYACRDTVREGLVVIAMRRSP